MSDSNSYVYYGNLRGVGWLRFGPIQFLDGFFLHGIFSLRLPVAIPFLRLGVKAPPNTSGASAFFGGF